MKNKNIKIAFFAISITALVSCAKIKDFGDTNVNPAAITTPTTYAILTSVESGISGWANDGAASVWIQHCSETQYPSTGLYDVLSTYFGFGTYTGPLLNLKTIIDKSTNPDEIACARILTQYIYWNLTDNLGDIPYSQAGKSATPVYDKQEDIYKGMITELKAAKNQFVNSGGLRGDILNNNDVNKWKKFANSLRAMMAIQLTKKFPATGAYPVDNYASLEFRAAIADGVMESNADNVGLAYPGGSFKNPYWAAFDGARDNGVSTTMYNLLNGISDARQTAFGTSTTPVPFGIKEVSINLWIKNNPGWSHKLTAPFRQETSTVWMMTASQLWMARAEAAARGWTNEDKSATFATGVNVSYAQWGLPAPGASYFTQAGTVLDGTPTDIKNDIKKIAEQHFLAAYPNGKAAWNSWRRTGFPVLTTAPDPLTAAHTTIPRRYTFTPASSSTFSEYSLNPVNVAAAVSRLVPATDQPESKIWWDQ